MRRVALATAALVLLGVVEHGSCFSQARHGAAVSHGLGFAAAPSTLMHKGRSRAALDRRGAVVGLSMVQTPERTGRRSSRAGGSGGGSNTETVSFREMSQQMQSAMNEAEADERVKILMDGMRGKSLNQNDFADDGVEMKVISFDNQGEELPLEYDPDELKRYYGARPGVVLQRVAQVAGAASQFLVPLAIDAITGKLEANDVQRTRRLREVLTSLGPFFIKLGQALAIRPDILSPSSMYELQRLCDKVPAFDNAMAMKTIEDELGCRIPEVFSDLSKDPIAAASLGQVYKGVLRVDGSTVAVKVQRPFVLETVSLDLYLMREAAQIASMIPNSRTDWLGLLDEFAPRFYSELDYVLEGKNGERFVEIMKDIKQVAVPKVYMDYTSRRVHVAEWIDGIKLSQSQSDDVTDLVSVGMIAYLTQLLESGFFHADPHPGNMLRTPDGRLAILDFGLMTQVTDNQKYGMIEAISHLLQRDYEEIIEDFITLGFIDPDVDIDELRKELLPALSNVFDQALSGGGARGINFNELAGDLALITFKFPFKIPPYFALIIRAIGVLEGIALVGNPKFAIIDEAFPYLSKRLLTDDAPRLRAALKYMVYGKGNTFNVERLIELLQAFETFVDVRDSVPAGQAASTLPAASTAGALPAVGQPAGGRLARRAGGRGRGAPGGGLQPQHQAASAAPAQGSKTKGAISEALILLFSDKGEYFRDFLLYETTNSVDAMSRSAAFELARRLTINVGTGGRGQGFRGPGGQIAAALLPPLTEDDEKLISNAEKIVNFLTGAGRAANGGSTAGLASFLDQETINEILPILPQIAPGMQKFGLQVAGGLIDRANSRLFNGLRLQLAPTVDRYFDP